MKRNKLKQEYYKETYKHWKTLENETVPTIDYVKWLEDKVMALLDEQIVENNINNKNLKTI